MSFQLILIFTDTTDLKLLSNGFNQLPIRSDISGQYTREECEVGELYLPLSLSGLLLLFGAVLEGV